MATTTTEITQNYIDLKAVLAAKKVTVPSFVLRLLEGLLHIKEINAGIYKYRDKFGVDFAEAFVQDDLKIQVDMVGQDNIPVDGAPIIAGNHPLGGPDGVALICAVGKRRRDILFPVTDFLMYLPGLRPVFVPVDKVHRNPGYVDALEKAFAGQNALLFFPAGLCSRLQHGQVRDLEWKPTFIKKSVRYQRPIIPFYVGTQNRKRFYRIANLRKRIGIKFNFEMALLPDEMFAQRGKTFRIVVGAPVPPSFFDGRHTPHQWAQLMHDYVYVLASNPSLTFQQYISQQS